MASWFAWRVAPASSKPVDDDWEEEDVGEGMCIKTAAVSTISAPKKTSPPSTTKTISTSTTVTPTFTTSSTTHIGATEGEAKSAPLPSAPPPEPSSTPPLTLAEENARLRTALLSLTQQLKSGDTSKIHMARVDGGVHPEQLMSQEDLQEFIAGLTKSLDEPTEEKAELITSDTDSSRSLFVRQQGDNVDEQEVALVDLDGIEWWTLVNPEEEEMERTHVDEKEMSDEGYVVLGNDDMRSALAEFIRQTMDRYPESQRLTPDQLKQMLEGTFQNLKEPSAMHKVWNWGKMLYTTYGWGSTALALYNDQRVIRLVATGLFKAATWVLVLVV